MAHGLDAVETAQSAASVVQATGADTFFDRVLAFVNYYVVLLSSIGLVLAYLIVRALLLFWLRR